MKKVLFIASIVLLYISPLIVQSQEKKAGPYDFKGDRLGMSIQDFNAAHYHLIKQFGNTYLEPPPSCSKQIIDGYTLCQYDSSIGGISTSVEVLFTDGVLTAINLRFSRIAANLTLFTDVPHLSSPRRLSVRNCPVLGERKFGRGISAEPLWL